MEEDDVVAEIVLSRRRLLQAAGTRGLRLTIGTPMESGRNHPGCRRSERPGR